MEYVSADHVTKPGFIFVPFVRATTRIPANIIAAAAMILALFGMVEPDKQDVPLKKGSI